MESKERERERERVFLPKYIPPTGMYMDLSPSPPPITQPIIIRAKVPINSTYLNRQIVVVLFVFTNNALVAMANLVHVGVPSASTCVIA